MKEKNKTQDTFAPLHTLGDSEPEIRDDLMKNDTGNTVKSDYDDDNIPEIDTP